MLAFVNTTVTKEEVIAQLEAHRLADEIVKGVYWEDGKGCAVGCTVHSDYHVEYEPRFGIPKLLAHLEDCIFEGLENSKAKDWPLRFMRAVKPGSDLSLVVFRFMHWLLTDASVNPGIIDSRVSGAVKQCAALLERLINGESIANAEWSAADSAARSAARSATSAAMYAADAAMYAVCAAADATVSMAMYAADAAIYAADAAISAERATAHAAKSAAESVRSAVRATRAAGEAAPATAIYEADAMVSTESAAISAARAAYSLMADKLIELIEAAPVHGVA